MIKAIIFDMDGVLFDTERILKECWVKTSEEMNFSISENELRQMRGSSATYCNSLFEKWYGGKINYLEARARRSKYLQDYIDLHSVPEKKGLKTALHYLNEAEIPFAIATSTVRQKAANYWKMSGITELISASVCGDEVTNSKPDPEIFLSAADKLNIPIEECMVVEDSINGLKAARISGAVACMIPDLTPYSEDLKPICDYVCEDLTALVELIKKLNQKN